MQRTKNTAGIRPRSKRPKNQLRAHHIVSRRHNHTSRPTTSTYKPTKVFDSIDDAIEASQLKNGDTMLVGGFGLCGIPMTSIDAVLRRGTSDLTVVSNNCGIDSWGLGPLLHQKRIKRMISSYVGENKEFERQYLDGELEVELVPQGTLAEKLRAGGAGIPAFFTPSGTGTLVEEGGFPIKYAPGQRGGAVEIASAPKESRVFNGKRYIMEESITGEVALVKAWRADPFGNLQFRDSAMAFNPDVARAGKFTIAEVDEIVPLGTINPNEVALSGGYINAVVQTRHPKKIERVVLSEPDPRHNPELTVAEDDKKHSYAAKARITIAKRAMCEIDQGMSVNLGIGIPTMVAKLLPPDFHIMFQSENGILGVGPYPSCTHDVNPDLINAGKETVTVVPGASFFSSSESFGMIRSGKIDMTILGAMEVASNGDIASWIIPGKMVKGMGGAMCLVNIPGRVVVAMEHCNRQGQSKILPKCTLPLTGKGSVDTIITELAVFKVDKTTQKLILVEKVDEVTVEQLRACTDAGFEVSPDLAPYQQFKL